MAFAEGTTTEQGKQPYKYGGKELDQSHGLNQYDVSARYYDPGYGRFTTRDPLSEKYYNISPYVYVGNNPMRFIDPDGRTWRDALAGYAIGVITNILPYSSNLRDAYSPNSSHDYNHALQAVDAVSIAAGGLMVLGGGSMSSGGAVMIAGGGTAAATVVGAPEGAAVAGAGAVLVGAGEATIAGGAYLMGNTASNVGEGYNRGKKTEGSGTEPTGRSGKTIADENGVSVKSYGTNDVHKPAHAHVRANA